MDLFWLIIRWGKSPADNLPKEKKKIKDLHSNLYIKESKMLMIKEAEKRKKMMCPQDQKEKGERDKEPENN